MRCTVSMSVDSWAGDPGVTGRAVEVRFGDVWVAGVIRCKTWVGRNPGVVHVEVDVHHHCDGCAVDVGLFDGVFVERLRLKDGQ